MAFAAAPASACEIDWAAQLCVFQSSSRSCLPDAPEAREIAGRLREIHEEAPWIIQQQLCDLSQIRILNTSEAYLGRYFSWDDVLLLNRDLFEPPPSQKRRWPIVA